MVFPHIVSEFLYSAGALWRSCGKRRGEEVGFSFFALVSIFHCPGTSPPPHCGCRDEKEVFICEVVAKRYVNRIFDAYAAENRFRLKRVSAVTAKIEKRFGKLGLLQKGGGELGLLLYAVLSR